MARLLQICVLGCILLVSLFFVSCERDPAPQVVEASNAVERSGNGELRFIARIHEASEIPENVASGEYKDALASYILEPLLPLPGQKERGLITVFAQIMRDRESTESTALRVGEPVTVDIIPMDSAFPEIQTMQRFDTLELLTGEVFYASDLKSRAPIDFGEDVADSPAVATWDRDDATSREKLLASESSKQSAMAETLGVLESERELYGGSWQAWKDRLGDFREDIQFTKNHEWATGPEVVVAVSMPSFVTNPEIDVLPGDELVALANQLAQQGIDFLYVSVPVKVEVYPEKFSKRVPTGMDRVNPSKAEYLAELLRRGVEVVYLEPAFQAFRENNPDTLLYMPGKDGHFSPAAAELTGRIISDRLQARSYLDPSLGRTKFEIQPEMHEWGSAFGWSETWPVSARRVKFSESNLFYENSVESSVGLVGDSHVLWWQTTMAKNAGVAAHLSVGLGFPITWEAAKGLQPHSLNRFSPDWFEEKKCVVMLQTSLKIFNLAQPVRKVNLQRSEPTR